MKGHPQPLPTPLPETAVPFVRELLLEVARRVPAGVGSPHGIQPDSLRAADDCLLAGQSLLGWLETLSGQMGHRFEQLDQVFRALLESLQSTDHRLHRAVQRVRSWVEEELAYSRSVYDVLSELRSSLAERPGQEGATGLVDQILLTLRAKESRDDSDARALSAQFATVQDDLSLVRQQLQELETHTRRLLDQSLRDELTGLWNRRAFEGRIVEEMTRALRYGSELSIALCEIDDLSEVNRTLGHDSGDAVLQALAARVGALLRRSDFFARCSGGQFAVILPNTALESAAAAAEKIRLAAARYPVSTSEGSVRVTLSIGLASLAPGDTADCLLLRAQEGLERARAAGRNRVHPDAGQLRVAV